MFKTIASVVAGYRAGEITEAAAKELLLEMGADDDLLTNLLSLGAGIAVGGAVGSFVSSGVDSIFSLFD